MSTIVKPSAIPSQDARLVQPDPKTPDENKKIDRYWYDYFNEWDRALRKIVDAINDYETRIAALEETVADHETRIAALE